MAGNGRIYQRGEIYFIAYSHAGHEFRESTRSRDIEDAKRLLASRVVAESPRETIPGPRLSFDQLAQLYLEDYQVRQFRGPKTAAQRVKNLRRFFHAIPAAALTTSVVRQYQAARHRQQAAAATINRETAALKRMCRLGERIEHLNHATGVQVRSHFRRILPMTRLMRQMEPERIVRGHFEAWFVVEFWKHLTKHLDTLAREAFGKVAIRPALDRATLVSVLTPYADEPPSLGRFLNAHLALDETPAASEAQPRRAILPTVIGVLMRVFKR